MQQSWRGVFYVFSAAVLWSTGGLFIKQIGADPFLINAVRTAVAGLALAPFARWDGIKFDRYLCGYILGYAWLTNSFVTATKLTSAANAIALQYTAPLFVFIYLVLFKKEKVKAQIFLPVLFIAVGIVCYLSEPNQGTSALGNLVGLSSGMALAVMTLCLPRLKNYSGFGLVSLSNICTALLLLPVIMAKGLSAVFSLSPGDWASLCYLGMFQLGLAYVLFVKGVQIVSSFRGAILALAEAVLNPIWVYLFVGEIPSYYGISGWFFVLGAVVLDLGLKVRGQKVPVGEPGRKPDVLSE